MPKSSKITCLHDFRSVVLTSLTMKAFEHTIVSYLKSCTSHLMDPYQFAYQANQSAEDAISIVTHHALQHLESPNTHTCILFINLSSAFNSIKPLKLFIALLDMNNDPVSDHWIGSFLQNRLQRAKVHNLTLMPSTPQYSCVICPWLYLLYTTDFTSTDNSVKIIKYSRTLEFERLNSTDSDIKWVC